MGRDITEYIDEYVEMYIMRAYSFPSFESRVYQAPESRLSFEGGVVCLHLLFLLPLPERCSPYRAVVEKVEL